MSSKLGRRSTVSKAALTVVGTLALVAGLAAPVRAQSLRPNILVVFDTSGSMLDGANKDGSTLCGGAGTTSRIFSLKKAMRDALAEVGTDEANFGLLRYPELEVPSQSPVCSQGHYNNDKTTALPVGCTAGCGNSCECGCRMPTHSTETTYGPWFDNGYRSALVVDVTQRPAGLKPVAADFDPADGNIADVYRWIDNTEDTTTGTSISDPELRTHANWYTPIGRSLFYARMYFDNYVKPADPKASCRTNIVIFVTDGAETCDTTTGSALDLTTCAQTGYSTFHPQVQACQLYRTSGVKTYILTDNSLTTNEKTTANAIANAGGTSQAIFVTLTDTAAVKAALVGIIASTVPPAEVCNGVDDNCNGKIDEGVSNLCAVASPNDPNDPDNKLGTGAKHCAVEICNCKDDDCDGQTDEGFPPNACGGPGCCAVPPETCNGLDDNCDGNIDEGFNVGAPCTNNGVGACKRGGRLACNAAGTGTFCDAPTVTPTPEVCNNIDDNCDGQVDNGTLPGVGEKCGNGLGACQTGTFICANGKLTCTAVNTPMTEVCNGVDDDCDGAIDNGTFPTVGNDCVCPGLDPNKIGVGVCKGGHIVCKGNLGLVCDGCIGPSAEICDGKDNDCDGVIDTNATCPSGFGCTGGQCTLVCRGGEFPCPSGYKCVTDFCVPQRCAQVTCPTGKRCDETTGQCVDLCAGVTCPTTAVCMQGRCLDCNTLGCDPGQLCINNACQKDTCQGVTCPNGKYCSNGACADLCVPGKCADGTRCVAGQCVADKCAAVPCGDGQYCDPTTGTCKADSCQATQCGPGQSCVKTTGRCGADPCMLIQCPSECWTCGTTAEGTGTCLLKSECKEKITQVGQRGGGNAGCGCAVSETGGSSAWTALLLGVALAAGARRRRRRQ
jgi:MYXO-CTERM domain-containing protein